MRHRTAEKISLSKLKQIALASKESSVCGEGGGPVSPGTRPSPRRGSEASMLSMGQSMESDRAEGDLDQESCRRFSFSSSSSSNTGVQIDRMDVDSLAELETKEDRLGPSTTKFSGSPSRNRDCDQAQAQPVAAHGVLEGKSIALHPTHLETPEKPSTDKVDIVSTETPEDLASILKEWADDFDKAIEGFFSKNKLFDLFGLWMMILLLDASLSSPTRIEWLGFCILSFSPFHRCLQLSFRAVFALLVFYGVSDTAFFVLFKTIAHPKLLPTIANMIVYGHVIGCIRGLDPISCGLWASLLAIDLVAKEPPATNVEAMPAIHCVSYGFYLLLSELFATITEYRNERLACNDVINGELRLYPTSLMTSSLFSKEMSECLVNPTVKRHADSWECLLGKKKPLKNPSNFDGGVGPAPSASLNASSAPVTDQSSKSYSNPQFYYFSNHYDSMNRFELCVLRISRDAVALTWSLPRSLLATLGGLAKCEVMTSEADQGKKSGLRPPPPVEPMCALKREEFAADEGTSTNTNLVYPPIPPLHQPVIITPADIRITVNGEDWQRERTCLSLLDMNIVLTGLKLGVLSEIVMWIKGYASIPLRICSTKDCVSLSPVRRRIFETDTRKSEHTFEPASLLDSKILRREEILDTLTHEQQNKKNMQANLKKMRKDFSKTLSSLRSEMDVVRKSMVKDAALEVKSKQRMQFLYEQLKQTEVAIGKLKDEAAFLIESEKRLSNQNDLLAKDLVVLKEGLKKVERSASKSAATNAKVIASAEADLKEAEEAHLNARDEIDRMKAEMKSIKGEMQAMQPVKPLKKLKNKYSSEHLMKKMEVELGIIEQDVVMARAACEGAVDRNSNMRRTVADETRFRQRLQDELRRVENDRVRDYSRVDDVLSNPVSRHTSQEMSGWASFVGGGILPALGSELQTWEKINQNLSGNGSQGTSSLSVSSRLSTDDGWPKMGIYDTGFRDSNPYSAFGHGALAGLDMRVSSKPYGPNSAHLELDGMIYNPSPTPVLLATAAEDIKQGYDAMDPMLGLAGHDILSSLGLDMDAPSSDFSNSLSIVGGLTTQ